MSRILIIGLDGASYHLVQRWRDDLPNLRRLMDAGTSSILKSIIPPRSIPAWYCFATGMNPAKLGVFGFSQRRPNTYDYVFANFSFCRAPAFWEWANRHGVETGIVHVPGTFPPRPVDGFLLSGWPAPANRGALTYTHPAALSREVDDVLGTHFEFVSPKAIKRDNDAEMLRERQRILQMHGDVAEYLFSTRDWQIGMAVFSPLDRASHQFWRHMDVDHPRHDPDLATGLGDALRDIYQASDAQVGRLLDFLNDDDSVFVVSDHGFGPIYHNFYVNEWLRREGYLVLEDNEQAGRVSWTTKLVGRLSAPFFKLNQTSPLFRRLAAPLKKRFLTNVIRNKYVQTKEQGRVRINHLPVDWSRTRAYCPDESSIYLNLRGRDPQGIVSPSIEAEQVLTDIVAGLHAITDPVTGTPLNVEVYRKEEIYSGPYLADAPELTLVVDGCETAVMAELGHDTLFDDNIVWSGTHNLDGLFIAHGPAVRAGARLDAGLMDVAPTVLHLAGIPVPTEADGSVLHTLFEEDSAPRRRLTETDDAGGAVGPDTAYTPEEQAQIEEQLRNLGYLE